MIKDKHWTAFFSQTGSEIVNVANKIGRYPDVVVTNKPPGCDTTHEGIRENIYTPKKPSVQDYRAVLNPDTVVTLHGWMRIIPKQICRDYEIYNLHPGLITKYPELKGKDPQIRAAQGNYDQVGVVIHQVTEHVDEGKILARTSAQNPGMGSLDAYLHEMAIDTWLEFFQRVLLK